MDNVLKDHRWPSKLCLGWGSPEAGVGQVQPGSGAGRAVHAYHL